MIRYIIAILALLFLASLMVGAACLGTSSSGSTDSEDDDAAFDDDNEQDNEDCIVCEGTQECVDALGQGWICRDHCCEPIEDDDLNDDADDDIVDDDANDDVDDDVDDDMDDDADDDINDDVDDDIDDDVDDDADDDIDDDVNDDADDDMDDDLDEEELSITLLWGESPSDLDLHMWAPHGGCEPQNPLHLYYPDAEINGGHGCSQDFALVLDDVTSYGPEIIEIYHPVPNEEFRLLVHDYSNINCQPFNCAHMSNSPASVYVRSHDDSWEFSMPPDTHANLWHVFNAIYTGDQWLVWGIADYCFEPSPQAVYGCD